MSVSRNGSSFIEEQDIKWGDLQTQYRLQNISGNTSGAEDSVVIEEQFDPVDYSNGLDANEVAMLVGFRRFIRATVQGSSGSEPGRLDGEIRLSVNGYDPYEGTQIQNQNEFDSVFSRVHEDDNSERLLDHLELGPGTGVFNDSAGGTAGGGDPSDVYEREVWYTDHVGTGPVLDFNDELEMKTDFYMQNLANDFGVNHEVQLYWVVGELEDRPTAMDAF